MFRFSRLKLSARLCSLGLDQSRDRATFQIHFHFGRKVEKELFFGSTVSLLIWKVAPSPPCSEKSLRLCFDLEVAPFLHCSGKSCRLRLVLDIRAVSALIWKNAPFSSWSRKSRRLRVGPKDWNWQILIAPSWPVAPMHFESSRFLSCAVSTLIAKMAPSRLGGNCHTVSNSVAKVMKWMRLVAPVAPFPESRRLFCSRKSRNGNSWPRTSGHTKYWSRYIWKFSVAKVCKCLNSVAKI